MDREKQIEEITKAMCGGCPDNKECMNGLCADWYRAEAIKEFAERLKETKFKHDNDYIIYAEKY